MANVQIIQRSAHLATAVRLEYINGRDGRIAKATVTAISNTRRGSGENRAEAATAIQWTLWREMAEHAAQYLGKGSHVNLVGRLRNNNYEKNGETIYGMEFTVEELDYLDSRAESEARRGGGSGDGSGNTDAPYANDADPDGRAEREGAAARTSRPSRKPIATVAA